MGGDFQAGVRKKREIKRQEKTGQKIKKHKKKNTYTSISINQASRQFIRKLKENFS